MACVNQIVPALAGSRGALEVPRNGALTRRSFPEVAGDVARAVAFFRSLGLAAGERVGFLGANCYEWIVADLAGVALGLVAVPFEQNERRDLKELAATYELKILLTDRPEGVASGGVARPFGAVAQSAGVVERVTAHRYSPEETFAIKFTSGSTHEPKALAAKAKSVDDSIASVQELFHHHSKDRVLVFLPLQLLQQRYWIYSAILFEFDVIVVSAAHALGVMTTARPTVIMGVPGFFEALRESFVRDNQRTRYTRALFTAYRLLNRWSGSGLSRITGFPRFKRRLGGQVRYLWTGSAPASEQSLGFFQEMGVPLLQGYGMNELCIVSKNTLQHHKLGSVGRLLPNKEVRIGTDGEILVRNVYEVADRYLRCAPGESELTFLPDGFVATGDLGYLDADGFLYITGRRKDLIVLSNGKKLDPNRIEQPIRSSGLVECCLAYATPAQRIALLVKRRPETDPAEIEALVGTVNESFATEERIAAIHEIPEAFTVENGLLTSQFKLKRQSILDRYVTPERARR